MHHAVRLEYAMILVLQAAIRHRIFDVLENGPLNIEGLQQATGAARRCRERARRPRLCQQGFTRELPPHVRELRLPCIHQAQLHGGMIRHTSEHLLPKWLKLNEVLASGKPVHSSTRSNSYLFLARSQARWKESLNVRKNPNSSEQSAAYR